MTEKKIYVEPTIEHIDMSSTEGGGNFNCDPDGTIPSPLCTAIGPEITGGPEDYS